MPTAYCRHIRTNGRRCCSPALRTSAFCYFHGKSIALHRGLNPPADLTPTIIHPLNTTENRQRDPILAEYYAGVAPNPTPGAFTLDFPPLEDRESIQVAISMLMSALGQNRFDPKLAGTMLYGFQVASANARTLDIEPGASKIVRSTVVDPSGQELAPDEDPQEISDFNEWLEEHGGGEEYEDPDTHENYETAEPENDPL
jgi:hypothetical protein